MIKSMTGFKKATVDCGTKKSDRGGKKSEFKTIDINLRTPSIYKREGYRDPNMIKNVLERVEGGRKYLF